MPKSEVVCAICAGSGKSVLKDPRDNRAIPCVFCGGTGRRRQPESSERADPPPRPAPTPERATSATSATPSRTLEKLVWDGTLADAVEYAAGANCLDQLFSDRRGRSVSLLHVMTMAKAIPGVELMLDLGADIDVRTSDGQTPLQIAIIAKSQELVHLLVERGADVNLRGCNGSTPLATALINELPAVAQYLLDHGADPDIPDDSGITARQIKGFLRLRAFVSNAPAQAAVANTASDEALLDLLEALRPLFNLKVASGKMTRSKAQAVQQMIDEFKQVHDRPALNALDAAARSRRLREIANKLTDALAADRGA